MSTPTSKTPSLRNRSETHVPVEAASTSRHGISDPENPSELNPGPIRTWPRVHPSRGEIRSCIEFSPGAVIPGTANTSSAIGMSLPRRPRVSHGSPIRPNSNIVYRTSELENDGQNTCRASRSSSIQGISGAHSLSSGGAGCAAGSSRRTSLSHVNSSRSSMINPTFLDMHHLIGLNHLNFGPVDVDYGDDDNSLSQSRSVSSGASGGSGMDHDSLEDLHRQQDAEFADILADFADQQHELEQRMPPRASHSQTSLSLSSVVSNEDTSESSCGTLSEIFESLSRFSEHCLQSVEALSSPIYLNTSSFTTTPTGPGDNFEFQFDYVAPPFLPQMEGSGGARSRVPGGHDPGGEQGRSGFLAGINESHRRRSEFFQGMLQVDGQASSSNKTEQIHGQSEQGASYSGVGSVVGISSGNEIQNASEEGFGGESSAGRKRKSGNILQDIGLELELFNAGLEFGNIIDLPAVPSTSMSGGIMGGGVGVPASGEDSIVAALNVLRESAGPLVSSLDWQGRCMELELALQRFGEQANRARLMLRDKVRNFSYFYSMRVYITYFIIF